MVESHAKMTPMTRKLHLAGDPEADALLATYPDARIAALRLRFMANVRGGDHVTAGGEVLSEDGDELHCAVWLDIDDGPRAVEGSATLRRT